VTGRTGLRGGLMTGVTGRTGLRGGLMTGVTGRTGLRGGLMTGVTGRTGRAAPSAVPTAHGQAADPARPERTRATATPLGGMDRAPGSSAWTFPTASRPTS